MLRSGSEKRSRLIGSTAYKYRTLGKWTSSKYGDHTNWIDLMAMWMVITGYHKRSIAENAMYRLKQLFGGGLASRKFKTQESEVHARIAAMNTMTYLGMPVSVRVRVNPS